MHNRSSNNFIRAGLFRLLGPLERQSRGLLMGVGVVMLLLIGAIDYLTGFEMQFSVFYLLEVGLSAWLIGKGFGMFMSVLSVLIWIAGDWAAGAHYSRPWILVWNALILMVVYFIVVWLLTSLRASQGELEQRVERRTQALTKEITERKRLESELLTISEREQRQFGRELHDSVCQHLTGTALAAQVLTEALQARSLAEATNAARVVELVEQGITLTRNLAHGLFPVELQAEGLMDAFEELAASVTRTTRVKCEFECEAPVLIQDDSMATHLYRIGQEAVRNALQHAKPSRIGLSLSETGGTLKLTVEDDGAGLGEDWQKKSGIGTRIMAQRAAILGGQLRIEPAPTGGTIVICSVTRPAKEAQAR